MDQIDYSRQAVRSLDEDRSHMRRVIESDVAAASGNEDRLSAT